MKRSHPKTKEERSAENRKFRDTHADWLYAYSKTPAARYRSVKQSAKRRNISFELSLEQFAEITALPCVYAVQPEPDVRVGSDRKDNAQGYKVDNCQPCCFWHNHVKSDVFTHEQMLDVVQRYSIRCRNAPDGKTLSIETKRKHSESLKAYYANRGKA